MIILWSIVAILGYALLFFWASLDPEGIIYFFLRSSSDGDNYNFYSLFFPGVPLIIYLVKIRNLQKDLVKKLVADKNHWTYNPAKNSSHWQALKLKFPDIFAQGNKNQNVQDEFWGNFKQNQKSTQFYSSIFEFTEVLGSGKNRSSRTYYKTIFSIKLNKNMIHKLEISPKNGFQRLFKSGQSFESEQFNQLFLVELDGQSTNEQLEIFKKLSPAVQINLVDLAQEFPEMRILFKDDTFLFIRPGTLFQKSVNPLLKIFLGLFRIRLSHMKTNFFKKVELHPDDEVFLQQKMTRLLSIAQEIPKYLD